MKNKKTVIVTGANKGIGFAVSKKLAERGYEVWMGSRNIELGMKAVDELKKLNLDVKVLQLDVTDEASVAKAFKTYSESHDSLDLLVNNAGIYVMDKDGPVSTVSLSAIKETFDVNYYGVIRVTQAFLPVIKKGENASIANISSGLGSHELLLGELSNIAATGYNSSKSALNTLTVMLSHELKEFGIKVNSICPGYTATDLNNHSGPRSVTDSAEVVANIITDKNLGTGTFPNGVGFHPW